MDAGCRRMNSVRLLTCAFAEVSKAVQGDTPAQGRCVIWIGRVQLAKAARVFVSLVFSSGVFGVLR
jgi:hypothetical protein